MKKDKVPYINEFAKRCFLDIADQDYLAARAAWRMGLSYSFLTLAHQSVEKYLKAILLYNRVPTKNLSHNISKAFDRVLSIPDITFDFPAHVVEFIRYLDRNGRSRYFEVSYYQLGKEPLLLDATVWHLRRYCFDMHVCLPDGRDLFPKYLAVVQSSETIDAPHGFTKVAGILADVVKGKRGKAARENLIYKNFFFGRRRKRVIKKFTYTAMSANTPLHLHPELFPEILDLVDFSTEVKKQINAGSAAKVGLGRTKT